MAYHIPALLQESIDGLKVQPDGLYVDVTFGGGGHAWEIFSRLTTGHLLVFDQDADAKRNAERFKADLQNRSFTFIEANFRYLEKYLRFHGIKQVDGVIADFGVSFHQFDESTRGFSTRFDAALDMRMNQNTGRTAGQLLNEIAEKDLIHILSAYGEIKNARTLAKKLIAHRSETPFDSTDQLKQLALEVAPRGREQKYLAQLYQAIRIEVNEELRVIEEFLNQLPNVLNEGGRFVGITYHSLEDRLVKNYLASGNTRGKQEKDFYGNIIRPFDPVNRKPIVPEEAEINVNNRARSAKLRIGEKRNGK